MRILLISDIHGNCLALDAVLADTTGEHFDHIVCLGDAILGGAQPAEVVARLREIACPVIMGNADDWLLYGKDSSIESVSDERRIELLAVREWQLSKLSKDDIAYIQSFAPTISIPLEDGKTLLCYHGSPQSFDHIILPDTPDEEVRAYLMPENNIIYTGGHTHMQFIRHIGKTFHFNPGSVGFAYRRDQGKDFRADAWAEYAVLSSSNGRLSLEFRRLNYNASDLIAIYRASGRPYAEIPIKQYGG
jgi:predicted phosphodiesterase